MSSYVTETIGGHSPSFFGIFGFSHFEEEKCTGPKFGSRVCLTDQVEWIFFLGGEKVRRGVKKREVHFFLFREQSNIIIAPLFNVASSSFRLKNKREEDGATVYVYCRGWLGRKIKTFFFSPLFKKSGAARNSILLLFFPILWIYRWWEEEGGGWEKKTWYGNTLRKMPRSFLPRDLFSQKGKIVLRETTVQQANMLCGLA